MSRKPAKYRLFALPYSLENVDFSSGFRFSRVTPEYILVYARKGIISVPFGKAVEIKQDGLHLLNKMDEAWLFDCGVSLLADMAAEKKEDEFERLSDMVNRLEAELEVEAEKEGDRA